jgi:hypothetical protein
MSNYLFVFVFVFLNGFLHLLSANAQHSRYIRTAVQEDRRILNQQHFAHEVHKLNREYYLNCQQSISKYCHYHPFSINSVSSQELVNTLDQFSDYSLPLIPNPQPDEDSDRRIDFFGVEAMLSSSVLAIRAQMRELDEYLAERPHFELIFWNSSHLHSAHNISQEEKERESGRNVHTIPVYFVLRRLPFTLATDLRDFTSINFPADANKCSSRPVSVCMDGTGTWGNRYVTSSTHLNMFKESMFTIYVSKSCAPSNRFSEPGTCDDTANAFECMFLPPTNCSLPLSVLHNCTKVNSLDFMYLSSATTNAHTIPYGSQELTDFRNSEEIKALSHRSQSSLGNKLVVPYSFYNPIKDFHVVTTDSIQKVLRNDLLDVYHHVTFTMGIHYRYNSYFRSRLDNLVTATRISERYGILRPNEQCVALHIRKDDRQIAGADMKEWCRDHTNPNSK